MSNRKPRFILVTKDTAPELLGANHEEITGGKLDDHESMIIDTRPEPPCAIASDVMPPEDATFYRDLSWAMFWMNHLSRESDLADAARKFVTAFKERDAASIEVNDLKKSALERCVAQSRYHRAASEECAWQADMVEIVENGEEES